MPFVLTEELQTIRDTARKLVQEQAPTSQFRQLRDSGSANGYSNELWRSLAELGFAGICIDEQYGGAGMGFAELGLLMTELGRTLACSPMLSTVALSANAIQLSGNAALCSKLLPGVCQGTSVLAWAHDEGTRFDHRNVSTIATHVNDQYELSGEKTFVLDGHVADSLIVSARSRGEIALFVVPADARGLSVQRLTNVDHRNAAVVTLKNVTVAENDRFGDATLLDRVLVRGTAALAAEMLGGTLEAFDQTLAYLKTRRQFDAVIGSFQALKHRMAHMFCEVELSKSIVTAALDAIDDCEADESHRALMASTSKTRCNDTFLHVAAEAIQMHGGVGVTDELDVGFFYKRAQVANATLGSSSYHRNRFATIRGY